MRIAHPFHLCRHSLAKVYNDLIGHGTSLLFIQKENRSLNGESSVKVVKEGTDDKVLQRPRTKP